MNNIFKDYLWQRYGKDIIVYSFAPLILVAIIAARPPLDLTLVIAVIINFIMYAFAFLYNDMEDRVEDAQSPGKRFRNPFGYGVWSMQFGYFLLAVMTVVSIGVSWAIGGAVLALIAASNLFAGFVYSNKMLRLKNLPVVDLLSHGYLLAAVTVLYFIYLPGAAQDATAWFILASAYLFSIGGDLSNEHRDFAEDRMAGLKNTASYLGERNTKFAQIASWVTAAILILAATLKVLNII